MNMKATKFLAVLAVLAFAFAAFAIAIPADEQDATISDPEVISENTELSTEQLSKDCFVVTGDFTVTIKGAMTAANPVFYVVSGKTATFVFEAAQTNSIKVQSATASGEENATTYTEIANTDVTFGKISNGTIAVKGGETIDVSALTGEMASITTGTVSATIAVSGNTTVNGVVTLKGATTITIEEKMTLSIQNKDVALTDNSTYAAGIDAEGVDVEINGKGTLDIDVSAKATSYNSSGYKTIANGIIAKDVKILCNATIDATGKIDTDAQRAYVYGCGIRSSGTITIGDNTTTTSKKVTITADDRAIYTTGAINLGKITVNASGGEYGIKGASLTTQDTVLTAKIVNANSNAATDGPGDGFVGIKAPSVTVKGESKISSDGILAEGSSAAITINGKSVVKITANTEAVFANGATWTGNGSAYGTPVWTKDIYGLVCAQYATLNTTPATETTGIFSAVKAVSLADSATLQVEPGCGIIADIQTSSGDNDTNKVTFNPVLAKSGTDSKASGNEYSVMAMPMVVGGSSNLVFGVGSVVMDGYVITGSDSDYTVEADGTITVTGTIELSGEIAVDIVMAAAGAHIIVPSDKSLKFDYMEITSSDGSPKLTILGEITGDVVVDKTKNANLTIEATNPDAAKNVIETEIPIVTDDQVYVITTGITLAKLESLFNQYTYVAIYTGEDAGYTLPIDADFKIPSGKTLFLGVGNNTEGATTVSALTAGKTVNISISKDKTLTVENAKVYDYSTKKNAAVTVNKDASLVLDAADVCVMVDVAIDGYVKVMNPLNLDATGTPTSDISVGYGNTLTINKLNIPSGKEIYVYGNLVVEGTNTVAYGGKIFTYAGSTVTVNGSLSVEGTVTTNGYTDIEGSVTVYRAGGHAQWTDNGLTVVYGSFDVTKARQDGAGANTLTITGDDDKTPYTTGFYLFGTSTISGTLAGKVLDYGELTFSGTAGANAEIEVRDGVTLNANSVTDTLLVTDEDAAIDETWDATQGKYKTYVSVFDSNTIILTDIKGLTISETVKVTTGKVDGNTVKYYVSTLSVTGITATIDYFGNITVAGGINQPQTKAAVSSGCVDVGDLTLGKNCELEFMSNGSATNVTVSGTVTAIADDAEITFSNTAGHVKILGQIYVNSANDASLGSFAGKVDATFYTYDSLDGSTNYILEPFEKALESILTADDELIQVFGSQSVSGEVVIPANGNVHVTADSTLSIGSDAMITVEANAVLDASAGTLKVAGVLFVTDKDTGLRYSTADGRFVYQVVTESEQSIMYSGLAGALLRAQAGDVITMVQDGSLTKSATVPAGVTLIIPNGKKLTIGTEDKEMTFTVDGMLVLERNSKVAEKAGAIVTILANGAIVKDKDQATFEYSIDGTTGFKMDNYVTFEKKIDGRTTTIFSNIEFAAATMDGGNLNVVGKVKGAAVTFAGTESEIIITIGNDNTDNHQNGIAVFSMTLVNAKVVIKAADNDHKNAGVFSGAIIAGSETGDAAITLSNATGVTIEAVTEETAAGDVDHFYIKETTADTAFDGKIAITAGTITMNGDLDTKGAKSSVFWVTEDAIFVVASGYTFTVGAYTDDDNVVVDGMMLVNGTLTVNGDMSVAGILTVVKVKTGDAAVVNLTKTMTVTGSVIVSEADTYAGEFNVKAGKLVLGTAATAVGDGASFIGPVNITSATAYIVAYPGADISDAKIDWNALTESSDAVSTEIYVFETLYATVFADSETTVKVYGAVFDEDTVIEGYDVKNSWDALVKDSDTLLVYWFTDSAYKANMTKGVEIGDEDAVYFTPALAKVYGKVTVGVGITLYLDGKVYEKISTEDVDYLTVGKHTVSVQIHSGYVGDNVTLKFNGVTVPATATGGTITVTADMVSFTLVADGAEPYTPEPTPEPEKESEWTVTTILLCVLVVLIAIMAVIVALRLNRN